MVWAAKFLFPIFLFHQLLAVLDNQLLSCKLELSGLVHVGHHEHVHHVHAHMSNTLRSKSTGQLIDDHHIRGSTRSRSRSKSKLDCSECCDNAGLSRSDRQSTRSTRWEVYRHVESPKKHLNSSQRRKSPIYKVNSSIHYYILYPLFLPSLNPILHPLFDAFFLVEPVLNAQHCFIISGWITRLRKPRNHKNRI